MVHALTSVVVAIHRRRGSSPIDDVSETCAMEFWKKSRINDEEYILPHARLS
jgi:hypothetical protein